MNKIVSNLAIYVALCTSLLISEVSASTILVGLSDLEDNDRLYQIDPVTGKATFLTFINVADCTLFCGNTSLPGLASLGGNLYGSNIFPDNNGIIGRIDISTGAVLQTAAQTGPNWSGLAADEELGFLYTVDRNNNDILTTISLDGTITTVGTGTGISGTGMAFDNAYARLYATGDTPDELYTIDINTGTSTLIGLMGLAPGQGGHFGLAFDEISNTLYANAWWAWLI